MPMAMFRKMTAGGVMAGPMMVRPTVPARVMVRVAVASILVGSDRDLGIGTCVRGPIVLAAGIGIVRRVTMMAPRHRAK